MPHLPVLLELARAREHGRGRLDERQLQVLRHRRRQRLAVPLLQLGLGIEQIHLARAAFHEQEDHVLRLGRESAASAEPADSAPRAPLAAESASAIMPMPPPAFAERNAVRRCELVQVDSWLFPRDELVEFSSTRLAATQAAASVDPATIGISAARLRFVSRYVCCVEYLPALASRDSDRGPGTIRKAWSIRRVGFAPAARGMRTPAPTSKNTGSFSRFNACSGVFDRDRRVQATFESGASKFISCGYGAVRWKWMYKPRRYRSGPGALRPLHAVAIHQFRDTRRLRRPDARPADRGVQQTARRRAPHREPVPPEAAAASGARSAYSPDRAPSVPGAPSSSAGRPPTSRSAGACASCSSPLSRNSEASQSSSSGCVGFSPCVPKSSDVRTMPRPKNSCHMRFTATRAVSGFSGPVSQCANDSRSFGRGLRQHSRHARARPQHLSSGNRRPARCTSSAPLCPQRRPWPA